MSGRLYHAGSCDDPALSTYWTVVLGVTRLSLEHGGAPPHATNKEPGHYLLTHVLLRPGLRRATRRNRTGDLLITNRKEGLVASLLRSAWFGCVGSFE
jgi:hypothetical protein